MNRHLIAGALLALVAGTFPPRLLAQEPAPELAEAVSAVAAVPEKSEEEKRLEKLTMQNSLHQQELIEKLRALTEERDALDLRYTVFSHKDRLETAPAEAELKKLTTSNAAAKLRAEQKLQQLTEEKDELIVRNLIDAERMKAELAKLEAEKGRVIAEFALSEERHKVELGDARRKKEMIEHLNALEKAKLDELELRRAKESAEIDLESKRLGLQSQKMKLDAEVLEASLVRLRTELQQRGQKDEWKKETNTEPDYVLTPFDKEKRRLTISDRRIPLNGPIFSGVSEFVTDRIHYYNNKSPEQPIFLVIDRCPGGSVMEGYRIVKAIEASKAPVHVVVKSYAASMAAVIATLADRSYAYPNAIILHHEMSSSNWGNMTQLKEQLELRREWERRLHGPVSKKLGLTTEEFRKKMYEHNSDGDWEEFADVAKKLKWVDEIVDEIRETGFTKDPDIVKRQDAPFAMFSLAEKVDEKGRRFVNLPRLEPYDLYHIHNPDNYYR